MVDRAIGRSEFYLTSALTLLLLLVFYVLPPPPRLDLSEAALDQSWQATLVEQFLRHAQCGTDLVFTYGPWGFLAEPRGNPAIYPWLLFGRFVLTLGVSIGAAFLALLRIRRRSWRCVWLVWCRGVRNHRVDRRKRLSHFRAWWGRRFRLPTSAPEPRAAGPRQRPERARQAGGAAAGGGAWAVDPSR
jgi:hypothetical protein